MPQIAEAVRSTSSAAVFQIAQRIALSRRVAELCADKPRRPNSHLFSTSTSNCGYRHRQNPWTMADLG
jgi:hypothetical protein